jgi:Family of unknown function (DUF5677)
MTNTLPERSLAFAKKVGETWRDYPGLDCKSYQRRFLYVNAFAAYHTAMSYWILHASNCFNDCGILARNLLERIINCAFAVKSPEHAVGLIAAELSEKIRRTEMLNHPPHASQELTDSIQGQQRDLTTLLGLLQKAKADDWNYCRRAEEAGLLSYYRFGYFNLSRFAHAGYEVARPQEHNRQSKTTDFIALIAPVITAANGHSVDCPDCSSAKCAVRKEFDALATDLSLGTLGNPNGNIG